MRSWEELPDIMRIPEVKEYYDYLSRKKFSLVLKRIFDIVFASVMLVMLSPVFIVLSVVIKIDSPGKIFFRQERVTQYGKIFRIHKFRTMISKTEGSKLTLKDDSRITRTGKFIRRWHLDEIAQLLDILEGNMSFVGTRPEVPRYVQHYTPEMLATLLLPAGITSEASIMYQQKEAEILSSVKKTDVEKIYIENIMPEKMKYNLVAIKKFSFTGEIILMLKTAITVFFGKG